MAAIRELAVQCLLQKEHSVPFPVLLEQAFAKIPQSDHFAQEKAFLMALCYGVLRNAGLLKQIVLPFCKKKPSPKMETCLLLALYERFFLGKEEHASVNEYVHLCKKLEGQHKAHAVNAILHAVLAQKDHINAQLADWQKLLHTKFPSNQIPGKKERRKLHQLADLPELFTHELHMAFSHLLAEESFSAPLPGFRINLKNPPQELPVHAVQISPSIFFIENPQEKINTAQNFFTRQGIASALVTEKIADFIQEKSKENTALAAAPLWDMCCGRGGKSLALLEKNINVVLATEPNEARLAEFTKECSRLDLPQPALIQGLAEESIIKSTIQKFPLILLDSPCSTSGTIARNPEVKYRITNNSLAEILQTQENLLHLACEHIQEKGYLFYCTCSVFDCENKGQLKKFLASAPQMECLHEEYLVPSALNPALTGHDILYFAVLYKK